LSAVKSSSSQIEFAHLECGGIGDRAAFGVQGLQPVAGERGTEVERGQLELAQHVGDAGEQPGVSEAHLERRVLVDEVGEAVGPLLLVHLQARPVPLGRQQFAEPGPDDRKLSRRENARERRVPVLVQA
jgi:hypothetical protein